MRKWIKEHPWRLEVIPIIIVIFALVAPLFYLERLVQIATPRHGLSAAQTFWFWHIFVAIGMLSVLIVNIHFNHITWDILADYALTLCMSILGFITNFFLFRTLMPAWVFWIWAILIISSWLIQSRLTRTIHLDVNPERELPDLSLLPHWTEDAAEKTVEPGQPFYYTEQIQIKPPRRLYLKLNVLVTISAVSILACSIWTSNGWKDAIWMLVIFILISLWYRSDRSYFKVTPRQIRIRTIGGEKINLKTSEIARCEVVEAYPSIDEHFMIDLNVEELQRTRLTNPDGMMEEHPYLYNLARRLEIETKKGEIHKFRLKNPEKVCKLIQTTLEA